LPPPTANAPPPAFSAFFTAAAARFSSFALPPLGPQQLVLHLLQTNLRAVQSGMHSQTHFGLFMTALLDGFGLNASFGAMTTLKLALTGTQRMSE